MNRQALNGNVIVHMPLTKTELELKNSKLHITEKTRKEIGEQLQKEAPVAVRVVSVSKEVTDLVEGDYIEMKPMPQGFNPHIIMEGDDRFLVIHYNMVACKIKNTEQYLFTKPTMTL